MNELRQPHKYLLENAAVMLNRTTDYVLVRIFKAVLKYLESGLLLYFKPYDIFRTAFMMQIFT